MTGLALPPKKVVLDADPSVALARIGKGLTVYWDDAAHWSTTGGTALFDAYLARVEPSSLGWFTTSMMHRWEALGREGVGGLREQLVADRVLGRVRHLFTFEVADDRFAPVLAFRYHEVDSERGRHAGWAQLLFPRDFPDDELLALMLELGQLNPVCSASAGWVASGNAAVGGTAHDALYGACKRYLGLDVPFPERGCRRAKRFLPSPTWLTLLGSGLVSPPWAESLLARAWVAPGIHAYRLDHGTLLRAGERPELGDANLIEHPSAMAEVAQILDPLLDPDPSSFGGRWAEDDAMHAWVHRFAALERWL